MKVATPMNVILVKWGSEDSRNIDDVNVEVFHSVTSESEMVRWFANELGEMIYEDGVPENEMPKTWDELRSKLPGFCFEESKEPIENPGKHKR
jgi:hypothetical protein